MLNKNALLVFLTIIFMNCLTVSYSMFTIEKKENTDKQIPSKIYYLEITITIHIFMYYNYMYNYIESILYNLFEICF